MTCGVRVAMLVAVLVVVVLSRQPIQASSLAWSSYSGPWISLGSSGVVERSVVRRPMPLASPAFEAATPQSSPPAPTTAPSATKPPQGHIASPTVSERGTATFYAYHRGQAAAGARLRDVLGPNWRGMRVRVGGPLGHLFVTLTDYESSTIPGRLIDLDSRDWAAICGDVARGVCNVVVTHG